MGFLPQKGFNLQIYVASVVQLLISVYKGCSAETLLQGHVLINSIMEQT